MKSMQYSHRNTYGKPHILEILKKEIPEPKSDELLIKLKASSVNRTDEGVLLGKPFIFRFFVGFPKPKITTTGCDFSGIVVSKGDKVTSFCEGDEVFGFLDTGLGSHAEFMLVSHDMPIFQKPKNISHLQAAASLEGAHYALNFLNKVDLSPNSRVFVNGATGAIGNAAIQILIARNVKVSFTFPTDSYHAIKNLEAERKIDYLKEDFTNQNEKYDFIFDAVGKSSFGKCKKILKPSGVYISSELGPRGENIPLSILGLFRKNKKRVIFPFPRSPKESIPLIHHYLKEGSFIPLIDKVYPLENVKEAFEYMLTGEKRGNVVLSFD